jgi:hypothetical protein
MKLIRRISISVEHREVSASITQTIIQTGTMSGDSGSPDAPKDANPPANCPECGGAGFLNVQEALHQGHIDPVLLQSALLNSRLHFQRQPDGRFWICRRSLQQLKEERG